jgi:hypothetical protein
MDLAVEFPSPSLHGQDDVGECSGMVMHLLGGDGGLGAEDAFGGVGVAVVEREVGAADVHAESVAGLDAGGDGAEIDGDLINLTGFHEFGFEQ